MKQVMRHLLCAVMLLAVTALPARSHAAEYYQFCARWGYTYSDQNLGEDYLTYTGSYGLQPAQRAWGAIQLDGKEIWSGYMDSAGCTPKVPGLSGYYRFWITSAVQTTNGAYIWIFPNSTEQWRWFYVGEQLPGIDIWASGTRRWTMAVGDTVASAAAVATLMAQKNDDRFIPGNVYKVYTEADKGDLYNRETDAVYLTQDPYTQNWSAHLKNVVAHELGHDVQQHLFGNQSAGYYAPDPAQELCRCDAVDYYALTSHCLQSREYIGTAQQEGFAHFIAADLFNRASDNDAIFGYYKELRLKEGGPDRYPPIPVSAYNSTATFHWMEDKGCAAQDMGVELDWLNFYYGIHNKGTYSMKDIRDVYRQACGGANCSGQYAYWSTLQAAADSLYGASSAKAQEWKWWGDWEGVNW